MPASPTSEPVPWEPVATCPDPVSDEEWLAWADLEVSDDLDPDRYTDEDECWFPGELDLTAAEQAGIDAAMEQQAAAAAALAGTAGGPGTAGTGDADACGTAGEADVAGTAGDADPAGVARELAARELAVQARRRGPGKPGSARIRAGEPPGPAAAFGSGQLLDVMPACPELALFADEAAGADDSYQGASDDELIGVLCAWDRLESHMAARKLAATSVLAARRPALEAPTSGRAAGPAPDEFTADELAHVLAVSRRAAQGQLYLADALDTRLPGTRAALRAGVITAEKARIIAVKTILFDEQESAAVEERVLGRAGRLTPDSLRYAAGQAVMDVAPEKARDQREHAAKTARVEQWAEDSGNAALAGRELPPAEALAAQQRVTWWARQLRKAGLDGDLDQLRARALLDLLLDRDSRLSRTGHDPDGARPAPGSPGGSVIPAGFTGHVTLTVPVVTALGLADRPGLLAGTTPVDPWLARDLLGAAAASPTTTWCVTFTDAQGRAVAHGCARPAPKRRKRGERDGPRPEPLPGGTGFAFTRTSRDGPPGGHGTWTLRTPGPGPDLLVQIEPLSTENCDHRHEARGHDPGVKLRHLTQVRYATCTSPVCRRPAATCDYEHNTPYETGGRTCLCNGDPKCRHDHRLKQHPRWNTGQRPDGTVVWTTPSGRQYTTEPTRYPI